MPHVPLSAYDRLFLAGHEALQRRGLSGHFCFIWLELSGRVDRATLDAAYRAASIRVPLVTAGIDYSLLTGRARWRYSREESDVAPIDFHDLAQGDAATGVRQVLMRAWREPQDPAEGRQLRLFCFEHGDRSTLVLRWPHYLMDLEGAQGFLLELQQAARGGDGGAAGKEKSLPYPPDWSRRWLRKWFEGIRRHRTVARLNSRQLPERNINPNATADFITRQWTAAQSTAILDAGKRNCLPGPLLHTRHLLVATARGLDDVAADLDMTPGDHYLLTLPMLRPRRAPRTKLGCNDLIVATIVVKRDLLGDSAALHASVLEQIDAYNRGGDEATWVFMSYVGLLRKRHYEWMLRRKSMMARCSIGFTNFRADAWSDGFLGSRVTNSYACGLPTIPPGVMLTFMRNGDRLNLGAGFFPHVCAAENVQRLFARIEHHLGVPI